ncbi:MAG TPA: bifunctional 4-hydroxy-2-oxoglutarate aldolase/2-dehydro-3-deoxy-phosphogluconate aldolase [Caulobacteraceae bacterium]|nr:bifunctional 4-hydroxy-2-oxoglutarate aldolase/2-dehydro-3-deoxy-phosphogluconate aldolase [Caulobacteraceae bacterium]
MSCRPYLSLSPVVPVLTIERIEDAVPLAKALVAGGLKVLEVTLRTPVAVEAMTRIAAEVPDAVLAAGTVLSLNDLERSAKAGARFAFSPGLADFMLEPQSLPILPGVATASEIMKGLDAGLDTFKFFPAVPAGGIGALKGFHGPFQGVAFCPTGGIGLDNAAQFLALPNVLCVGGSWIAPTATIKAGDFAKIQALAAEAMALARA